MKKVIIILFSIFLSIILFYCYFVICNINYGNNEAILMDEDKAYYESIIENAKKSKTNEVNFKDIFRFDWDRAYITKSYDGEDKGFYENVDSASLPVYEEQDGIRCIVFLKGNKVVYNYVYLTSKINFISEGQFFTKDKAAFEIVQKSTWFHKIALELKR